MGVNDLTQLDTLKQWLPISTANVNDDGTIARLITSTSQDFMRAVKRPDLLLATYNEVRMGDGGPGLVLYHWPVVSITTLTIAGAAVAASADKIEAGYYVDQDIDPERVFNLWLAGGLNFTDGQPVAVAYKAGYVQPGGTIEPGQIALPGDIEQAVIDWCTYRYKERPNVGATRRRSSEGDSTEAPMVDAPPNVLSVIARYTRDLPSLERRRDEPDERMRSNYNFTAVSGRK